MKLVLFVLAALILARYGYAANRRWREAERLARAARKEAAEQLATRARRGLQNGAYELTLGAEIVAQAQSIGCEKELMELWDEEISEFEALGRLNGGEW